MNIALVFPPSTFLSKSDVWWNILGTFIGSIAVTFIGATL
jgi:hypothetical protein